MPGSWQVYLQVVSIVLGLGSFAAAAQWYARYGRGRDANVLDGYAVALAVAVLAWLLAHGWTPWVPPTPWALVWAVPVGVLAGSGSRWADRRVVRWWDRRRRRQRQTRPADAPARAQAPTVTPTAGALLLGGGSTQPIPGRPARTAAPQVGRYPLASVVAVAVLEEAFYRGVLLQAALSAPSLLATLTVVATSTLAFSLAHLFFGWEHVLAKTPLGLLTLGTVLLTGTVLAAVVAHVCFNVSVWRDMNRSGRGTA